MNRKFNLDYECGYILLMPSKSFTKNQFFNAGNSLAYLRVTILELEIS